MKLVIREIPILSESWPSGNRGREGNRCLGGTGLVQDMQATLSTKGKLGLGTAEMWHMFLSNRPGRAIPGVALRAHSAHSLHAGCHGASG
jgi:hypothetical protein